MARVGEEGARRVTVLARILAKKREEIAGLRSAAPAAPTRVPHDVVAALSRGDGALRLIAEVKLRSPSAGPLSTVLAPAARARAYAEEGAAMVSVLCDETFFDGGFAHLAAARAALDAAGSTVPLLAKEFVLERVQISAARAAGADAVLVIARIVSRDGLGDLVHAARGEGIEPFVEVVDELELEAALAAGARVVGVNARDLDTLAMDAARAARVLAAIPRDRVAVHLSGLRSPDDVRALGATRADAALMGEALMRNDDPRPLLRELVRAANSPAARPPP